MRIDGGQPTNLTPSPSLNTGTGLHTQTGTYRGEQATVKDASSVLTDAAEEMSLHTAEKVEQKHFSERKIKGESSAQLMRAEQITAYLEASKQFDDPEKLAQTAKRMLSGQESPRQLARQQSGDVSHQYALLRYALSQGEKEGAKDEVLETLRDALADLEMESGPQIRAGLNVIQAAAEFGQTAQDVAQFQSTYRDVVLGEASLAQTFKLALERFGTGTGQDFPKGLQSLIKALGQDLAAARPSTDSNRLQSLIQDLYQLEVTATLLDACQGLADDLRTKHQTGQLRPVELLKDLVDVTNEKWVTSTRFTGMADKQQVVGVAPQIFFQTTLKGVLRDIPPKVFPDADTRQSILNAQQEALDRAIDKEEE